MRAVQGEGQSGWYAVEPLHGDTAGAGLPERYVEALAARHGGLTDAVLGGAKTIAELGQHFGHTLYAREVDYLITHEWARTADDVLWRRTKCGLHLNIQQKQALEEYVTIRAGSAVRK